MDSAGGTQLTAPLEKRSIVSFSVFLDTELNEENKSIRGPTEF